MTSFVPCPGTGSNAVSLERYPSQQDGLGWTRAKTFGNCPSCGYLVKSYGLVQNIKIARHKARTAENA